MKRQVFTSLLLCGMTHQVLAQHATAPGDLEKAADATAAAAAVGNPGDLAKAADATAEVAAVSAGDQPVAPPAKASSEDIDLSAMGLEPGASAFDDKLNLYGFADFTWQNAHWTKSNPYVTDTTGFMLGNLNLYVAKNLTPKWRSLAEIRFMYTPNGSAKPDGTVETTTAGDAANFGRTTQWGSIAIERAYIEYDLHPRITVRAGHWLTPYGIWNTDHGSPTIIGVYRPYIVGEGLFPEHQTGLDVFGSVPVGDAKLTYHVTASNGRSETEATADTDRKLAFGGRLELEAPLAGTLKLGVSAYDGRYTGATTSTTSPPEIFDERMFAVDAQWDHGGLHLQSELITRHKAYVDGNRPFTVLGTMQPDGDDVGFYGMVSYRFTSLWNVTPFALYEDYRPLVPSLLGDIKGEAAGLNFRPSPNVVLKFEGIRGTGGPTGLIQAGIYLLASQVAWVF